jgi:hypothetical protein
MKTLSGFTVRQAICDWLATLGRRALAIAAHARGKDHRIKPDLTCGNFTLLEVSPMPGRVVAATSMLARVSHRRADPDNPLWWMAAAVRFMFWALILELWLAWAVFALPVAGCAKLGGNDELTRSMLRSLRWKLLGAGR